MSNKEINEKLTEPLASLQQDYQEPFWQLIFQRQHGEPHSLNYMCIQLRTSLGSELPANKVPILSLDDEYHPYSMETMKIKLLWTD